MFFICYLWILLCPVANERLGSQLPDSVSVAVPDSSAAADSSLVRRSFFRRLYDYFNESNVDRTDAKRFDVSFALGPNYSNDTKFGLGILAAGLYRLDKNDKSISPSDVSVYANVSTTGFYMIGVEGNNIFSGGNHRIGYDVSFYSMPTDFWGIGYDAGNGNSKHHFEFKQYKVNAAYTYKLGGNCFVGGSVSFYNSTAGRSAEQWLPHSQRRGYTYTGLGVAFEYDSRDFIPNPYEGVYVKLQGYIFPKGLSSASTFYRVGFSIDYYHRMWRGAILACDLFTEFNEGRFVPWTMLAELGGSRRMRGYYKGRYRDRDIAVVQVELRQKIYRRHGVVMWVGAGNVFESIGKFDFRHTLPDMGIGYRFEFKNRVNLRLDFGVGRNGTGINFNINEAF